MTNLSKKSVILNRNVENYFLMRGLNTQIKEELKKFCQRYV